MPVSRRSGAVWNPRVYSGSINLSITAHDYLDKRSWLKSKKTKIPFLNLVILKDFQTTC
jgi:hypothetical protein